MCEFFDEALALIARGGVYRQTRGAQNSVNSAVADFVVPNFTKESYGCRICNSDGLDGNAQRRKVKETYYRCITSDWMRG